MKNQTEMIIAGNYMLSIENVQSIVRQFGGECSEVELVQAINDLTPFSLIKDHVTHLKAKQEEIDPVIDYNEENFDLVIGINELRMTMNLRINALDTIDKALKHHLDALCFQFGTNYTVLIDSIKWGLFIRPDSAISAAYKNKFIMADFPINPVKSLFDEETVRFYLLKLRSEINAEHKKLVANAKKTLLVDMSLDEFCLAFGLNRSDATQSLIIKFSAVYEAENGRVSGEMTMFKMYSDGLNVNGNNSIEVELAKFNAWKNK